MAPFPLEAVLEELILRPPFQLAWWGTYLALFWIRDELGRPPLQL